MLKDKGLVIGIILTLVIIVGGVFFFSKPSSPSNSKSAPVSQEILAPASASKTSGVSGSDYLPATSSAQVTLVEFGDYECPACGQFNPLVKQLMTEYAGKINLVFRNFPLPQHKNAIVSAKAAEAAGLQGKFWQMHEKLYATQAEWSKAGDPVSVFAGYAQGFGLNVDQFKKDMELPSIKSKIDADVTDSNLIRIDATPTFYINGVKMDKLPFTYDEFKAIVAKDIK